MKLDYDVFNYLFEGAKSTKYERKEDFSTELIGFLWEVDLVFKEAFKSIIQEHARISLSDKCVIYTQIHSRQKYRYDIELVDNDKKIIIENKIYCTKNQLPKYLEDRRNNEFFILLKPIRNTKLKQEGVTLILWEELLTNLLPILKIEDSMMQLRKSFFKFMMDTVGIYPQCVYDLDASFHRKLLADYNLNAFRSDKQLLFREEDGSKIGIELDLIDEDFFIFLEDTVTPRTDSEEEYDHDIKVVLRDKYLEFIQVFDEDKPEATSFCFEVEPDRIAVLEEFILEFYSGSLKKEMHNSYKYLKKKLPEFTGKGKDLTNLFFHLVNNSQATISRS